MNRAIIVKLWSYTSKELILHTASRLKNVARLKYVHVKAPTREKDYRNSRKFSFRVVRFNRRKLVRMVGEGAVIDCEEEVGSRMMV